MHEHHKQSIDNLLNLFKDEEGIVAIVLGGSVAKGCERPDSDIDVIIVVTDERYAELEETDKLSECIGEHCTYEGGYFDIKYCTAKYLTALAERGSEPSRNAFLSSKCIFAKDESIVKLIEKVPVFQKQEKDEKLLSFYSAFNLSYGYFWGASDNNPYLRTRVVSDIVLFGFRLLLQENEVLFPCHKALLQTVSNLKNKPDAIIEKAESFLANPNEDTMNSFVAGILDYIKYRPPENYSKVLTRFIDDNELWWYKERPVIAEW